MKRIAIVLPYLKAGGTERQAYYIANHLKENHRVTVITIEETGSFKNMYEGIETHCLDVKFSKKNALLILKRLIQYLKINKFDLVISRAWNSNSLTGLSGLITKTPYILFLSGSSESKTNYFKKTLQKLILNKAKKIISVSNKAKINCVKTYGVKADNIEIVQNGVDIQYIENQGNKKMTDTLTQKSIKDHFVITFLGRLEYRKGLDILLEALAHINNRKDITDLKLLIIGGGELEKEYKQMTFNLGISDIALFLGEKKNPFNYLKQSDIFVFPSRSEGFPNALLEAMALGLPSIASDCETGPSEVIKNNYNGILVNPGDSHELSSAILKVYNERKLRDRISQKAASTIMDKHSLKKKLNEIERIVNSI